MNRFNFKFWFICVAAAVVGLMLVRATVSGPTKAPPPAWPEADPAIVRVPDVVIADVLNDASPRDLKRLCLYRSHPVNLIEGRTYVFDLTSADFDTFLMLTDEVGHLVATDADCMEFRGSRIVFRPTASGSYRLIVSTASASGKGAYELSVTPRDFPPNLVLDVRGFLTATDATVDGFHAKVYHVSMTAGRTYMIDLASNHFDTCLKLERPEGGIVAYDDEGALGLNARIRFDAPADGVYRIVVTSFAPRGSGAFALRVCEE